MRTTTTLFLLCVLLVSGCDNPTDPQEPEGTLGGAFILVSPPTAPVEFARLILNPWSSHFVLETATADGLSEIRGTYGFETTTTVRLSPETGEPLACTFHGYQALRCGTDIYRLMEFPS
jgi:hypothetical protein